jgi:hypothetical protein
MPHMPYVDSATIADPEILGYLELARREGTVAPAATAERAGRTS